MLSCYALRCNIAQICSLNKMRHCCSTVFLLSKEKSGAVCTSHHDISRGIQGLAVPRVLIPEEIGERDGIINPKRTVLGFGPHAFLRWPHLSNVLKGQDTRPRPCKPQCKSAGTGSTYVQTGKAVDLLMKYMLTTVQSSAALIQHHPGTELAPWSWSKYAPSCTATSESEWNNKSVRWKRTVTYICKNRNKQLPVQLPLVATCRPPKVCYI